MHQVGKPVTVPFFNQHGQRLIVPHVLNDRDQLQTKLVYKLSCLKWGIMQGTRGQPWLVAPSSGRMFEDPFEAITYRHLPNAQMLGNIIRSVDRHIMFSLSHVKICTCMKLLRSDAFYEACEEEPGNPAIVATVQQGLHTCIILSERTPKWALRELRDLHNNFHSGAEPSCVDIVLYVPTVEQDNIVANCLFKCW